LWLIQASVFSMIELLRGINENTLDEGDEAAGCAFYFTARKRTSPPDQQRPRNAVSPRCRRNLPWRLQALQDDPELLILRPTTTPARIHHFEPLDLGTALITVHMDSSQNWPHLTRWPSAEGYPPGDQI
jgi:hypothetical protein